MHPGNIFVDYENPKDPRYICVDFGIIGTLSAEDQRYLAENFYAFFNRDYRRVAELHVESGWVPIETRVDEFEMAIRTVSEPIFERPLKEISCAQMLIRLFQTGHRFNMEIQPQLVLLQKTLFSIEGLGRQLYPDLDLWSTAKPYMQRWMREHYSPQTMIKRLRYYAPYWIDKLPEIPMLLHDVVYYHNLNQLAQRNKQQQAAVTKLSPGRQKWRFILVGVATALLVVVGVDLATLKLTDFTMTIMQSINVGFAALAVLALTLAVLLKRR